MGASYLIRQAFEADGEELGLYLRLSDCLEVYRSEGADPHRALRTALELSETALAVTDLEGGLLFLAGAVNQGGGLYLVWLLGSKEAERYPRRFYLAAREVLERLKPLGTLFNFVDGNNERAAGFLRKLGFTVESEAVPLGPGDAPFKPFYLCGKEMPCAEAHQ